MLLYLITNTKNGKRYVGITSKTLAARWRQHVRKSQGDKPSALHRAMAKHGADSFTIEQIGAADDFEALKAMEVEAIAAHGTYGKGGYNLTIGGDGATGFKQSQRQIDERAARWKGGKHTPETKAKMSAAHLTRPPVSEETRRKHSIAMAGKTMPEAHRLALAERNRNISEAERERRRVTATGNKWAVGATRTDEQRKAIGDRRRGTSHSDETKAKIREARAKQPPTFGMKGKQHSDEARAKMSAAHAGKRKSPETIERMRIAARKRAEARKNGAANP